jgi:hypothetical protein
MRTTVIRWIIFGLGCAQLAACSSSDDKKLAAVDRYFNGVGAELCSYVFRCCEASEIGAFKTAFLDQAGCERYYSALAQNESLAYRLAVSRGGVRVEESPIDGCIAALKALPCGSFKFSSGSAPGLPQITECSASKTFLGLRQVGELCETGLDCVAGTRCYVTSVFNGEGVCVPLRKLDEPCTGAKDCESPLTCAHPKDAPATCRPPAKEGESCLVVSCDATDTSLYCDYSKDSKNPVCARRLLKKEGEACTASGDCEKGLYCDFYTTPTNRVCARLKKTGEACTSGTACESSRCDSTSRTCTAALCDGKGNGPPPVLDQFVVPPKDFSVPERRPDYATFDRMRWQELKVPDKRVPDKLVPQS